MNTFKLSKHEVAEQNLAGYDTSKPKISNYLVYLLFGLLLLLWPLLQQQLSQADETIGYIDPNIWLLILLSLISFMILTGMSWWLLHQFWTSLGLPELGTMVLQFNNLALWQQLGFYWLAFVSLLLAAVGVLTAVL